MPQIWEQANQKKHQDFSPEISTAGYPSYYLQNFHQTNGYFSDLSANLYDLQVEISLVAQPIRCGGESSSFTPWAESFDSVPESQIRVLDVACGTGRTLKLL